MFSFYISNISYRLPFLCMVSDEKSPVILILVLLLVRYFFSPSSFFKIFSFHFHALEKEMATHSSVLAWRIPGMGEPGGLPSMGSHRVGHD